jgi:membrane protease YdiL (CAAX protease family)
VTVLVLTLFYYWTRVDTIGVTGPGRQWFAMTGGTLSPGRHNLVSAILLGLVPLAWARLATRASWKELGLGVGNPRRGLLWLGIGLPVAVLAGWVSSGNPEVRAVYPLDPGLTLEPGRFAIHALIQLGYYAAWEVLFRGVLLGTLRPVFGFANANLIQTALSVVAHFGRPFPETFAAIPAGLAFGGVARTTGSVWYVIIIHWVVGLAQDWFIIIS